MASYSKSLISTLFRNVCRSSCPVRSHNKYLYRYISSSTQVLRSNESSTNETDNKAAEELSPEQKEIISLKEQLDDFKDKYQRTLADRENVRMRLQKEIKDAKLYGIQGFCKDILEVTDVFRKALDSVPSQELQSGGAQLQTLHSGLTMTETQLIAVLRRHGLERVVVKEGDSFDPEFQQVVVEVPLVPGCAPGTVATVLRDGWSLHERCIRSVQVGVFKQ